MNCKDFAHFNPLNYIIALISSMYRMIPKLVIFFIFFKNANYSVKSDSGKKDATITNINNADQRQMKENQDLILNRLKSTFKKLPSDQMHNLYFIFFLFSSKLACYLQQFRL